MRQRQLGQLEHAEHVGTEGLLPLLRVDVLETITGCCSAALLTRMSSLPNCASVCRRPCGRHRGRPRHRRRSGSAGRVARRPCVSARHPGVGRGRDGHVGTFAGEQHRHRAADTTVAGDDGDLAGELAGRLVSSPRYSGRGFISPSLPGSACFCGVGSGWLMENPPSGVVSLSSEDWNAARKFLRR